MPCSAVSYMACRALRRSLTRYRINWDESGMKVCRTDTQHPVTQRDGASATKTLLAAIGVTIALATPALAQNARSIANEANQKWIQAQQGRRRGFDRPVHEGCRVDI